MPVTLQPGTRPLLSDPLLGASQCDCLGDGWKEISRSPKLALHCTTSLYGSGSSQYNRVKVPSKALGDLPTSAVFYGSDCAAIFSLILTDFTMTHQLFSGDRRG